MNTQKRRLMWHGMLLLLGLITGLLEQRFASVRHVLPFGHRNSIQTKRVEWKGVLTAEPFYTRCGSRSIQPRTRLLALLA